MSELRDYVTTEERLHDRKKLATKLREIRQRYIDEGGELLSGEEISDMLPRAERRPDDGAVLIAMFIFALAGMIVGSWLTWFLMS